MVLEFHAANLDLKHRFTAYKLVLGLAIAVVEALIRHVRTRTHIRTVQHAAAYIAEFGVCSTGRIAGFYSPASWVRSLCIFLYNLDTFENRSFNIARGCRSSAESHPSPQAGGRGNPPFGFVIRNCKRKQSGLQRRASALRVRDCGVRNSALDYEPGRPKSRVGAPFRERFSNLFFKLTVMPVMLAWQWQWGIILQSARGCVPY